MKPYEPQFTSEALAECQRLFGELFAEAEDDDLATTDPDYAERIVNFAFGEVPQANDLDEKSRFLAILAVLMGSQSLEAFGLMANAALDSESVTPVELKEVAYQATAYLGIGCVLPFLGQVNAVLEGLDVELPLEPRATTTMETRREAGTAKQVAYFGPQMKEAWKASTINTWLAANCFGDYYTREGLTDQQREMVTFCYLIAQGGCEPQATAHAMANINLSGYAFMHDVVEQVMPYIGYPRTLNAMACLDKAKSQLEAMGDKN